MQYPLVTLCLPIRNEAVYIRRCLQSILNQDYPGEMEVLVVDGMSTDNTRITVHEFCLDNPSFNIKVLDNPEQIVPNGMNIALRQGRGEIIIRVDGHCLIASDYVRRCVEHILKDGVDGVGGSMETIGETSLAKAIAIGMSSPFGVGNSAFRTVTGKNILADTVPFPAYTRDIIEQAGFYDEELVRNQDDEYNYRIREMGGKILLAADVRSIYFSRATLSGLWRQYFQYGFYKVRVFQKHPRQMSLRQFIPPLFVFSLLASLVFTILFPWGWLLLSCIFSSYLLANLTASVVTVQKRGWRYLLLLPLCFAILHLSYGSGFLVGLVKFIHRWNDKKGKVPPLELKHATRS